MDNAIKETVVVFGRLARPGDTVETAMATGPHRSTLLRLLGLRGLALEFDGEWTVAATIAWSGK
jgi:hypothetical protein